MPCLLRSLVPLPRLELEVDNSGAFDPAGSKRHFLAASKAALARTGCPPTTAHPSLSHWRNHHLNLDRARNVHLSRQFRIKRLYLGFGATKQGLRSESVGANVHRTDRRPGGQYGQQSDGSSFGHNSSWLEEAGDPMCATPGPPVPL